MSTTLARRIRRIGLERTTYRESTEERLTYDENNAATITQVKVRTPERHRAELSLEELTQKRAATIQQWREQRRSRRRKEASMRQSEKEQKNDPIAKAMAKVISKHKS